MLLPIIRSRYRFPNFPDSTVDSCLRGRVFLLKRRIQQRHLRQLKTSTKTRLSIPFLLLQQGLSLPYATVNCKQHEAHRERGYSYTG